MPKKIMLVEDDTNLSEIYQARLEAEGFAIISAKDGEEALALAVNEHPDLILCDVMMPRISGFDMLDILRGTAGIQDTKVVMMTALSQAEDKARAEKLGADRYLVKSQVTLEDVVKTVHEVLGDTPTDTPPTVTDKPTAPTEPPKDDPIVDTPSSTPTPTTMPELTNDQTTTTEQSAVDSQIQNFVADTDKQANSAAPEETTTPANDSGHSMNKVVEPAPASGKTDIHELVDAENKNEQTTATAPESDPNQIAL